MAGSYLTARGTVSRHGQWRVRRGLRARDARGRLDMSDNGLVDLSTADRVTLGVYRRAPFLHRWCGTSLGASDGPILAGSSADGTLFVSSPGVVERLFPDGWGASVPPRLYDVRITVTVGPEPALIADDPVRIL